MWNKVYLALLVVGVLVGGFFAYYSWSWLQSIGDPRVTWDSYNYYRKTGVYFTVSWTVVLVVMANVILWNKRNAWALWVSHLFFVVFSLVFLILLHLQGIGFCLENHTCDNPSKAIGVLLAIFGSLAVGVVVFVDQYVVLRLQERMHGKVDHESLAVEKENSREEPES